MAPPVTRSRAKATEPWVEGTQHQIDQMKDEVKAEEQAVMPDPPAAITVPLTSALSDLEDLSAVLGKDARQLRDATVEAVSNVWRDSHQTSSQLAQTISESNANLLSGLNQSFGVVDDHIKAIPTVASLSLDSSHTKIAPFSGSGDATQFSVWVRRLQDIMRLHPMEMSSEQKANFLVAHLDGIAREKVDELADEDRRSYESIIAHLRSCFEGPHQRQLAREALATCRQEHLEPSPLFANRLLNLVKAATAGQDPSVQKDRALEEFLARLRPNIRYFVKLDNPTTFEQAVNRAQAVEHLLAEATADRLINPAGASSGVSALGVPRQVRFTSSPPPHRNSSDSFRRREPVRQGSRRASTRSPSNFRPRSTTCFNCGGTGHLARQCPSQPPSVSPRPAGTRFHGRTNASTNTSQLRTRALPSTSSRLRHDLDDARSQIAALSISLREKQEALDNSSARVAALVERNNELSRSTFAGAPAARSASNRSPVGLNLLTLCLVILIASPVALSQPAWLCPHDADDHLIRIPFSYNCSRLIPDVSTPPRNMSIHLFRPNSKRYDTPASLCRVVEQITHYWVNFFGARFQNYTENFKTVSVEHCKLMVQHGRCEHGTLAREGSISRTSNSISIQWPTAPFGCCVTHSVTVRNCFLLATKLHIRHGAAFPDSSVGDTRHCRYEDGSCVLRDGSVLLWVPEHEQSCQFLAVSKLKGHLIGHVWLSESKEFALSWDPNGTPVRDCDHTLTITDQGYAIASILRSPRAAPPVGIVTSNQLAAQLLAVEDAVQGAATALFQQALTSLCDRSNLLAASLHPALLADPTHVMRRLLRRNDVAATYRGNGVVQVHRCMPVPRSHYDLRPFNASCFAKPQVVVSLPSSVRSLFFLDVNSFVLSTSAERVACSPELAFFVPFANGTVKFNPISGSTSIPPITELSSSELSHGVVSHIPSPALTIFHNLVLTNLSELISDQQLTEMWQTRQYEQLLTHLGSQSHEQISHATASAAPYRASLWEFFPFSPFDLWVTVCCCYATFLIVRTLVKLYIKLNYPQLLDDPQVMERLRSWAFRRPALPPPATPSVAPQLPLVSPPPCSPRGIQVTRVELDASTSWPPKVSASPVVINSLDLTQHCFIAQVPITVNTIRMLALIDTGAAITLTSKGMAPLLGIFTLQPSPIPCAIGISGAPVTLLGYAHGTVQIGGYTITHPIHFTDTSSIPSSVQTYNIILGNDILQRLPGWSIDYANRTLAIGGSRIAIMALTPEPQGDVSEDLPVRVSQTTVLEPGSETLVPCMTASSTSTPLMLMSQRIDLAERSLLVSPSVMNAGRCYVLVANPTSRKQVLYKDQAIASAVPLSDAGDGTLACREHDFAYLPTVDAAAVRPDSALPTAQTPSFDLSRASVDDTEKQILVDLFEEYRDRFSFSAYDLGSYQHTQINIKTTTEIPPMKFRPPRIPVKFQKELDDHINRLLKAGRITESDTPWVHNTVLVKKKDGSLRVCLDFRPLNDITIPDHFPLPRIEDILAKIAGNRFYTTLDLASGYMQLLLSPDSQYKCGWATHRGIYQFTYLPFGLKNAGAYFCRVMARVLGGLEENCLAYIDDVVIFNKSFQEHVLSLRKVFERFRKFNLKISHKKFTEIARSQVTFLGHVISEKSYSPAERNVNAIRDFPTPTSVKEVKGFIGMANFFRRFIPNFAMIVAPLYELTKEKSKFIWGPAQQEAFAELKRLLTSAPCLAFPQDKDFILHTDGSQIGVGAALFQETSSGDKSLAAVGYFSKTLSDSQRKWSTVHIELFAMVSALRFFKPIIYGNLTRIFSDHQPLTHLLKHNKTHDNIARWVVELQSYNITIQYLKGSTNVVADCLSRAGNTNVRFQDGTRETEDIIDFPYCLSASAPYASPPPPLDPTGSRPQAITPYDVLVEQQSDPLCSALVTFLQTQEFPSSVEEADKPKWLALAQHCVIKRNGCLYHQQRDRTTCKQTDRLVLPEKLREPVFLAFHSSPSAGGHFHWRKTLAKIGRKYYWPHMAEHIFQLVTTCDACQRKRAAAANREPLIPVISNAIFDKVYLDLTGPLQRTDHGNKYILVMIDHFSKYVVATPLRDCTAISVAHAIMSECILKYGVMTQLVSDNASYLKGELLTELGKMLRVDRYYCTPYHHEGNGACERVFATFHAILRTYIDENQRNWDTFVAACAFMYNTSVHSSTNETPFFMMFGRDPIFNIDLIIRHGVERHVPADTDIGIYTEGLLRSLHSAWQAAFQYNQKQREAFKRQYDTTHLAPLSIRPGERVYLRDMTPKVGLSQKLCNPWLGQFRVVEVDHPHLTIVSITSPQSTPRRVHMNQVKKCKELSGPVFTSPWLPQPEQEALVVTQASPKTLVGYEHGHKAGPAVEPPPKPPTHSYNTRFRARCGTM